MLVFLKSTILFLMPDGILILLTNAISLRNSICGLPIDYYCYFLVMRFTQQRIFKNHKYHFLKKWYLSIIFWFVSVLSEEPSTIT